MGETIKLKELCEFKKGKKVAAIKDKTSGSVPYLLINTLRGLPPDSFTKDKDYTEAKEGDVLIVCDGANSGLTGTGLRGAVGSTIARLRFDETKINKDYITFFLKLNFSNLNTDVKGAAIPHLKPEKMLNLTIPKISLNKQNLTVQEIETQFTRLDSAIKSLKAIKTKLNLYRKSVLKAAFEGGFVDNFKYEIKKLGDFERKGGGTPSTKMKEYWGGEINWITSASIDERNKIHFDKKITEIGLKNSSANLIPKGSVIVVTRVGLGKVAVNEEATAFSQDSQGIICKGINPYFLMWQMKSAANEIISKGQGTTINGITVNKLNDIKVKTPDRNTQAEIVNQIESRFSVIDKLEEVIDSSLKKAETLRKSILKSAFEGKLVN
ncbi:MAG: restriction endonuclease subunit S [Actinobacteria bacterium]|nr:restriction endonuclease subunit S [Actinomycetota bacterium]